MGIMLDAYVSSAWIASIIEDIQSSGFSRVELVILNPPATAAQDSSASWNFSLFQVYERWDRRRNKQQQDAMAQTDVSQSLLGVPCVSVKTNGRALNDGASAKESAAIRNYNLDVLFRLDSGSPRCDILSMARYGVWSFHFGGESESAAGPPLLKELLERKPVSESSLRIQTPDGGRIVYQSQASTDQLSLYRNRNPVYWKTAEFALRTLRELASHGIDYLQSLPSFSEVDGTTPRAHRSPNDLQLIRHVARQLTGAVQARFASLSSTNLSKWYLAIRKKTDGHTFDDPSGYQLVLSPGDRFHADPFLVEKDGKTFLFCEDFRYVDGRAVISCSQVGPDGTFALPVEVLRRPYHLSYPFVFEDREEMYMIPECRGNRTVELYRAINFPTQWTLETVLMSDVNVVDATIQKLDGRYWMFAGISNGKYSNSDELGLFFADSIRGPWIPHPRNPLVSDVRRARPAGALFYDGGRLIRPSQDCSKAYGYGLVFSEILTLTETEYEERVIGRIDPFTAQGHEGTHTYTRSGQFEVVDRFLAPKYARVKQDV